MRMRAFFPYLGSKILNAHKYPEPKYSTIIEPFAGSASYSILHHEHKIILVELDKVLVSIWELLISSSKRDILSLPLELNKILDLPEPEKNFIGFWWNRNSGFPSRLPTPKSQNKEYAHSYWSEKVRKRISEQVGLIKHWKIVHGHYTCAPVGNYTYFIDPPYQLIGSRYRHNCKQIDYANLSKFCRQLSGQRIVCEGLRGQWLDFKPLYQIKSSMSNKRMYKTEQVCILED
jgi:site-specific DNA-adenine methylase